MISIALAAYNGSKYIREQIDSIIAQTYQDFELIICDDCSTDGTWQILEEYSALDTRIKIYRNPMNMGYRRNFEKIALMCTSEMIAFCDQDDIWLPNHLQVLYEHIGSCDVCSADAEIIDSDDKSRGFLWSDFTDLSNWPTNALEQSYTYWYYRNPFPGCNSMYRKSFLSKIYPILTNEIQLHDTFADTMACTIGNGISYVKIVTMKYRFHQDSVTSGSKLSDKQHPWKFFLRKLVSGSKSSKYRYCTDRLAYISDIMQNCKIIISEKQAKIIKQAKKYHQRRATWFGRILNAMFEICNWKKIYNK